MQESLESLYQGSQRQAARVGNNAYQGYGYVQDSLSSGTNRCAIPLLSPSPACGKVNGQSEAQSYTFPELMSFMDSSMGSFLPRLHQMSNQNHCQALYLLLATINPAEHLDILLQEFPHIPQYLQPFALS